MKYMKWNLLTQTFKQNVHNKTFFGPGTLNAERRTVVKTEIVISEEWDDGPASAPPK
ncbi:MAG TPA: hypothetical protein VHW46_02340 [Terracidiphilus sp.]|jgi:hypothetical protein|nr:hypothetical protein [Terracidiphilus sp.]